MADEEVQPQFVHVFMNMPFPSKLDMKGNVATNWKKFKRVWENYEIVSRLKTKENEIRTATFLTCIDAEALEMYDGLKFDNDADKTKLEVVLQKFETFCIGETNETYERYKFNKRDQEQSETIDTYVASIRTLSKTCNYGEIEESLIRDRIVIGIKDNTTRKKLLQDHKLKLKKISNEDVQYVRKKTQKPTKQHSKFSTNYSNECKWKETQTKQRTVASIWQSLLKLWNKKPLYLQMQKNKRQKE
jgi:hypothetical protein